MHALVQQVQQTIQDYQITVAEVRPSWSRFPVAQDRMVLLHTLWHLHELLALKLCVAHLNHQMRPTAAADAQFVETTAHPSRHPLHQ